MSEDRWTLRCCCGAPCCRGIIADFRTLQAALQQHYLEEGIVSDFVVRELKQPAARRNAVPQKPPVVEALLAPAGK
jgi:hypothetical protein